MNNFVLIPDSFKGTMSSSEICEIMASAIKSVIPDADIREIPVADGGEGSVDAFLRAVGGKRITAKVKGPFMEDQYAYYGILDGGEIAVVEMAACAGLPLVEGRPDPAKATTYGVGQLILDAASKGVKKIIVGLGGSATNDGGCGAAAAAGVRFFDRVGEQFIPAGGTLCEITDIDLSGLDRTLKNIEITAMCDIDNPLHGPEGAAYVFGPQKGAGPDAVKLLDAGLAVLGDKIKSNLGADIANKPGAGAAGGMGAGMSAFFGAELKMGIEVVLDAVRFDDIIIGADLILTGEGKIDAQSLRGKVVIGVARRANYSGIPVVAIVGDIDEAANMAYDEGVAGIFSINRLAEAFAQAKLHAREDLAFTVGNLIRFCKKIEKC
jgi:glycerate kinase